MIVKEDVTRFSSNFKKTLKGASEAKQHKEPSTVVRRRPMGDRERTKNSRLHQPKPDPKRLIIGRTNDNQYIQVPELWTHAHALVCGRTGVGKVTRILHSATGRATRNQHGCYGSNARLRAWRTLQTNSRMAKARRSQNLLLQRLRPNFTQNKSN